MNAKLNPPPSGRVGSGIWICGSSCMNAIRSFACFLAPMPSSQIGCSEVDSVLSYCGRDTLAADNKTIDQRFRQFRSAHARLHIGDVIRNTPEFYDFMFEIGDRKTSAGVSIARLADRAGVKQISALRFDAKRRERLRRSWMNVQHFQLRSLILVRKPTLMMRVAEKRHVRCGVEQSLERLRRREHIFVFVLKRTVNQHDAIRFERARRKLRDPFQIVGRKLRARPINRRLRDGIEIVGLHQIGRGLVVISSNGTRAEFANLIRDFVGIGAVPDNIAETRNHIPTIFGRLKSRVECRCVGVNVAKNEDSHPWFPKEFPKRATEYKGTYIWMHGGKTRGSEDNQSSDVTLANDFPNARFVCQFEKNPWAQNVTLCRNRTLF